MTGQLVGGHPAEPPLLRGAPVQVDAVHVGGHQEQVRGHVLGQQLAGQVLVDDRFHAGQGTGCGGRVHGRDASAAGADDDGPAVQQPSDRLDLQDLPGPGRRHHPAPGGAVLPEGPALLGGQLVGVVLGVHRPDELGRMGERRVGRVHHDHREQGGHLLSRRQQVPQFLLDQVADHALGARVQHVQRVGLGALVRLGLKGQQADLRAIAVGHHDAVVGGQRRDRAGRDPDVVSLHLGGHRLTAPQQRIAAQGDHDPHLPASSAGDLAR